MRVPFIHVLAIAAISCDSGARDSVSATSAAMETSGSTVGTTGTSSSTTASSVTTPTTTIPEGTETSEATTTTEDISTESAGARTTGLDSTTGPDSKCGDGNMEIPEECDDGNMLAGDECSHNCSREWIIFVTSKGHNGLFGGLSEGVKYANAFCQIAAQGAAPPLSGTYKALISDDVAKDLSEVLPAEKTWILRNGNEIASTEDMFNVKVNLKNAINIDESGTEIIIDENAPVLVWTGANGHNCNKWTTKDNKNLGGAGSAGATDNQWEISNSDKWGCNNEHRLYCFRSE